MMRCTLGLIFHIGPAKGLLCRGLNGSLEGRFIKIVFKNSNRTSQKHCVSITNTNWLMLFINTVEFIVRILRNTLIDHVGEMQNVLVLKQMVRIVTTVIQRVNVAFLFSNYTFITYIIAIFKQHLYSVYFAVLYSGTFNSCKQCSSCIQPYSHE
jgi:hypothetical protein